MCIGSNDIISRLCTWEPLDMNGPCPASEARLIKAKVNELIYYIEKALKTGQSQGLREGKEKGTN